MEGPGRIAILGVLSLGRGIPFPDANRFLDSQSGRETRRTIATVLSVTTLTSEKLPDEDNDDEKHDD